MGVQSLNWVVLDYYNDTRWSGGSSPVRSLLSKVGLGMLNLVTEPRQLSPSQLRLLSLASQLSPVSQMSPATQLSQMSQMSPASQLSPVSQMSTASQMNQVSWLRLSLASQMSPVSQMCPASQLS